MSEGEWGKIPGETPIDDLSGLLVKGVISRRNLNQIEAENIAICTAKYLVGRLYPSEAPFTFSWMFLLHGEMFGKVWAWVGTPRKCDLNLGCPWFDVESRILELVKTLPHWEHFPLVEQTARIHHQAVQIHPFLNGNGRWARMLANIWLRLHGRKSTEWPEPLLSETSEIRVDYLKAIRAADGLDYGPLVHLHRRFTPGEW